MKDPLAFTLALATGLSIGTIDTLLFAKNDDGTSFTLVLLFASGFTTGASQRERPWRWALVIAAGLPAMHFLVEAVRNVATSRIPLISFLGLYSVAVAASVIGAFAGSAARYMFRRS